MAVVPASASVRSTTGDAGVRACLSAFVRGMLARYRASSASNALLGCCMLEDCLVGQNMSSTCLMRDLCLMNRF